MKNFYVQTPNTPVQCEQNIYSSLLSTSLRTLLLSLIYIHHIVIDFVKNYDQSVKCDGLILLNIIWVRQNFGIKRNKRIFYSISSHNVSTTPNLTCAHRSTFLLQFVDNTNYRRATYLVNKRSEFRTKSTNTSNSAGKSNR